MTYAKRKKLIELIDAAAFGLVDYSGIINGSDVRRIVRKGEEVNEWEFHIEGEIWVRTMTIKDREFNWKRHD